MYKFFLKTLIYIYIDVYIYISIYILYIYNRAENIYFFTKVQFMNIIILYKHHETFSINLIISDVS